MSRGCLFCDLVAASESSILVVSVCPVCGDPVVVLREHKPYAGCSEALRMVLAARRVHPSRRAEFANRCCPGHAALHLRAQSRGSLPG